MAEARLAGKTANVKVDTDGGGAAEQLLGITRWNLAIKADAMETTGMDSLGIQAFIAGCSGYTGGFSGHWDTGETDIIGTVTPAAPPLLATGTRIEWMFYVVDATLDSWFAGDGLVTGFNPEVNVDGSVDFTVELQGTEALTYALTPA